MPASRAYRDAGFVASSGNSAEVLASRTLRKVQVAARLAELRAEQAKRHEQTHDEHGGKGQGFHFSNPLPTKVFPCISGPADYNQRLSQVAARLAELRAEQVFFLPTRPSICCILPVDAAKTVNPATGKLRQEGCRRHASIKGL